MNVYNLKPVSHWSELGDFVAGTTAPLALIWFVLGFFLQIKEIRYQRIEITSLGKHMKRQADAVEKQLEYDDPAVAADRRHEHFRKILEKY